MTVGCGCPPAICYFFADIFIASKDSSLMYFWLTKTRNSFPTWSLFDIANYKATRLQMHALKFHISMEMMTKKASWTEKWKNPGSIFVKFLLSLYFLSCLPRRKCQQKNAFFIVNIISCGLLISDFLLGGSPFIRLLRITTYLLKLCQQVLLSEWDLVKKIKTKKESTIPQYALINV
mgnify:CR=1 FL=1